MQKHFNIAGPCIPGEHYMLPALERNPEIQSLIDKKQYFVIHAARQTGKTTLLKSLVKQLNDEGTYYALYCSLEAVQGINEPEVGIGEIINNLEKALYFEKISAKENFAKGVDPKKFTTAIYLSLAKFSQELGKPFVLLFDEADCLSNGTLITFLRQLRDGYINRGNIPFVHSIALVGMRDIRDYKAKIREDSLTLGSSSPFNIITESLSIGNFTEDEVGSLYQQHTELTGQIFEKQAIEKAWYWTEGQPWLVNALARECVEKILKDDYNQPITAKHIDQAAENIMLRRDTHIDSLLERLKEERVKKVIQPVLLGSLDYKLADDDTSYCIDLGIIKSESGKLIPSNPIYREVIIRTLTLTSQHQIEGLYNNIWIDEKGDLKFNALLQSFQQFWRENSDVWVEKYQYKEAAPHLILQAFLQWVINGGGHIDREYATGRKRMDLCVHFGNKKYPIELKLWYGEKTVAEGIDQLSAYMDSLGEKKGWLVIFDRSPEKNWDEKIYWQEQEMDDRLITIVGC
ncbi:MAG: AAA-like domain-containing protein [Candidatus Cyclobacteriaceae bacterium M3_2C_046]